MEEKTTAYIFHRAAGNKGIMIAQSKVKLDSSSMPNPIYFLSVYPLALGRLGLTFCCYLILAACASQPQEETLIQPLSLGQVSSPQLYIHDTQLPLPAVEGLNQQLVEGLLSAEIAGQRNQLDYALNLYMKLAMTSQHPAIAERATWIAQFAQQPQAALDAATIWAASAPQNPDAQRTAAGLLLQNELYLEAFEQLRRYEQLGGESNYALLAGHLIESNSPLVTDLYHLMAAASQDTAQPSSDMQTALALLSKEKGQVEQALEHLQQALEINPKQVRALQLQARIYRHQNLSQQAVSLLEEALTHQPHEVRLWLELARTQLHDQQLEAAETSFAQIIDLQPDNPQIRLALARIQLETEQFQAAKVSLQRLIEEDLLADQAYFYLGQLAEEQGQAKLALDYYGQVDAGPSLLDALRARAKLLVELDQTTTALHQLDRARQEHRHLLIPLTLLGEQLLRQEDKVQEAVQWLDAGRQLLPEGEESLRLLYARALTHYELGQLGTMEEDLRSILSIEPNNAMALNALGYTLVNKTDDRIQEGLLLIQRAHALHPESPEILDSLGWAYFRLGRLEEAKDYLKKAYRQLPDEEIAAHLAETLWELGQQQQALQLLQEQLENQGSTPTIDQLIERRPELKP